MGWGLEGQGKGRVLRPRKGRHHPAAALVGQVGMDQFDEARQNGTVSNDPQVATPSGGRAAISNEHTLSDEHDQGNRVRDKRPGHKRTVTLHVSEFIGCFVRHLLFAGFKRSGLAAARAALDVPTPSPATVESVADFLRRVARIEHQRCQFCGSGQMHVVARLPPAPRALHLRGPP